MLSNPSPLIPLQRGKYGEMFNCNCKKLNTDIL